MIFSIITPSFNQLDCLKRCMASVADQAAELEEPIRVRHHIQDAQSTDGTPEWLAEHIARQPVTSNYQLTFVSEADEGMYDAINRGWEACSAGSDVVAWLNCDEQYFPGALKKVAEWFCAHPEEDVLFGEVVITDAKGNYTCSRKMVKPSRGLVQTDHLPFFSAAMFIRTTALNRLNLYPDPKWKNIGDVELVLRMMQHKVRIGILHEYLSAFSESGDNLGLDESARQEYDKLRSRVPAVVRKMRQFWVFLYRLRKWMAGNYQLTPFSYSIYTENLNERTDFVVESPEPRWLSRLQGRQEKG